MLLIVVSVSLRAHGESKSWKNIHGQEIFAELVAAKDGFAYFLKGDGKIYQVSLVQFSPEVQKLIASHNPPELVPGYQGKGEKEAHEQREKAFWQRELKERQHRQTLLALRAEQAKYQAWLSQFPPLVQQAIIYCQQLEDAGKPEEAQAYYVAFIERYQQAEMLRIQQIQEQQYRQEMLRQLNQINQNLEILGYK